MKLRNPDPHGKFLRLGGRTQGRHTAFYYCDECQCRRAYGHARRGTGHQQPILVDGKTVYISGIVTK